MQGVKSLVGPTPEEQVLFDALDYCVLPTSIGQLLAADGSGRVEHLRVREKGPQFRIQACSGTPGELPWLATPQRLYVLREGRAAAFELAVEPVNAVTDLEPIVSAVSSRQFAGTHWFFINTASGCLACRMTDSGLELVATLDGGVFASSAGEGGLLALGGKIGPTEAEPGSPLLADLRTQRHVRHDRLNTELADLARRAHGASLPSATYMVERLYCDAYFACAPMGGELAIVGGIAEARVPLDLPEPSERTGVPQLYEYVGTAYLTLTAAGVRLDDIDLGRRFLASVETEQGSPLYVVKTRSTNGQALSDISVYPEWPRRRDRAVPLTFAGCAADTAFHKFRVAYRQGRGYLAVANTFWGFSEGRFAPRDLFLTSVDGVHWTCVGTSGD